MMVIEYGWMGNAYVPIAIEKKEMNWLIYKIIHITMDINLDMIIGYDDGYRQGLEDGRSNY